MTDQECKGVRTVARSILLAMTARLCESYEVYCNHDESIFDRYDAEIKEHMVALYQAFPKRDTEGGEGDYAEGRVTMEVLWPDYKSVSRIALATVFAAHRLNAEGDIIARMLRENPNCSSPVLLAFHAITREQ